MGPFEKYRLLPGATPFKIRTPFTLTRHTHLKLARHDRILQRVNKPELWAWQRRVGKENSRRGVGDGNIVMDDVTLVIKVDRLQRLSGRVRINKEQIDVPAVEICRPLARGSGTMARQNVIPEFEAKGVRAI